MDNNIFTNMVIPQLGDPDFQQSFSDFCTAIKQNIERLMSVQYTKGEPGNSVFSKPINIGYTQAGGLTNMAACFLNTIFGTEFNAGNDILDVNNIIEGIDTNITIDGDHFVGNGVAPSIVIVNDSESTKYMAIPSFMDDTTGVNLDINIDEVTGKAYLASPYIFIDGRIAGLNKMIRDYNGDNDVYNTFHDFSVSVYGAGIYDSSIPGQLVDDPSTWTWEFMAVPIVPKLYFDENINEFCWNVNGQETGVTAQGIKGDDGVSPNMIIAIGEKPDANTNNTNNPYIIISRIQYIDNEDHINWATKNSDGIWGYSPNPQEYIEIEQPKADDLVLVFFPSNDHIAGNPYENAYMGNLHVDISGKECVYFGYDGAPRCDIFESIRQHDHWRLMMSINSNTTGSPRGYVLPADAGDAGSRPSSPVRAHMTYSEVNEDSSENGFSKLHSAPVASSDTLNPFENPTPTTDHIGDWQIDYNMDVKGDMAVQGTTNVQGINVLGATTTYGDVTMKQNATVQGNLNVQGMIRGTDIQIIGKRFPVSIQNPYLACVSRFTNITYFVDRAIPKPADPRQYKNLNYTLNFSAKLEVTIGMISSMLATDFDAPHRALQGFVDDTWGHQNGDQGVQNNQGFCNKFNNWEYNKYSNSNINSKLYNAVKYIIPINLVKTVEIPVYGRSEPVRLARLFDFPGIVYNGTPMNADTPNINDSHIQVGCNTSATDFKQISYRGYVRTFLTTSNTLCCQISKDVDVSGTVYDPQSQYESDYINYIDDTKNPDLKFGGVQGILNKIDNSSTDDYLKNKYEVNGNLYYPPMDINISYYIDIFARIFEYFVLARTDQTLSRVYDYITFGVTPVGCMVYSDNNTNKKYMAAIWNGLNTDNYMPKRLSSMIINSSGIMDNGTKAGYGTDNICLLGKHELNPLVSNKIIESDNNGRITGTILYGSNINSSNIISVFNCPNTGSDANEVTVQGVKMNEISANYFDITSRMRIVENNVKVCPNNVNDGAWQQITENGKKKMFWYSIEDVPVVVLPYEGKVGVWNASSNKGAVKLGVGNMMYSGEAMSLWGMLVYPYTPAVISLDANGDPKARFDKDEDATVSSSYTQGTLFIDTGRMLGVSNGEVYGFNHGIISNESIVPPVDPDDIYVVPENIDDHDEQMDPPTENPTGNDE